MGKTVPFFALMMITQGTLAFVVPYTYKIDIYTTPPKRKRKREKLHVLFTERGQKDEGWVGG